MLTFYLVLGGQLDTPSTGWILFKTCSEPQVFFVCISHIDWNNHDISKSSIPNKNL